MQGKRTVTAIIVIMFLVISACYNADEVYAGKKWTIDDVDDEYAIECDVSADGYGDGYHAKLVFIALPECGVSFGMQYDNYAREPYKDRLALLFENIYSNRHEPGQQEYYRPSDAAFEYGRPCHLMLSMNSRGVATVYLNYKKIASYRNESMAGKVLIPRIEVACKHNGDVVSADFSNIRVKDGVVSDIEAFWPTPVDTTGQINATVYDNTHVSFSGSLTGLEPGEDWDSAYNAVSSYVHFIFE